MKTLSNETRFSANNESDNGDAVAQTQGSKLSLRPLLLLPTTTSSVKT